MPKRVPNISTVVIRFDEKAGKNRRVTVEPGKPFNFTQAEIDQILAIAPGSLRKPVNETAVEMEEPVEDEDENDDTEEEGEAAEPTATEGVAKTKKPGTGKKKTAAPAGEDDDI